jgi:transcriptional regulator with XRE-family HTH domain
VPETDQQPNAVDLGARVRAVRELAGLQPREVAKAAGMGRRELQAVERGSKRLTGDELRALAGALGVDPDVLVGVGFEGDLVRADTVDDRIDQVIGHDPDRWDDLPGSVADLPPALPVNLPNPERR